MSAMNEMMNRPDLKVIRVNPALKPLGALYSFVVEDIFSVAPPTEQAEVPRRFSMWRFLRKYL